MTHALVIHGGAGARPGIDYTEQREHMAELIARGGEDLAAGRNAVDMVSGMVADLEASGLYVAGRGSAPNANGIIELDASIMDGATRKAGAVAAISNIVHPVLAARSVMDEGRYVMLAAEGARAFALANGIAEVLDPESYYTMHVGHGSTEATGSHGTVGAVALDNQGNLAAATSSGGTFNKPSGRVGDTPLIGAGTWADDLVAVSCTGIGEAFIRTSAAHDVSARMRYGNVAIGEAARAVLTEVENCDGDGGLIAIDRNGRITMPFNSQGMKRAAITSSMPAVVRIFEPEPV
jgi:isoaspartyl peptidase/L-asparaginase-like protein (Ntn-hydrolase superfamily)